MRPRLRVPLSPLDAGEVVIDVETSRYVCQVHRLRRGDVVTVFDPETATEAVAELVVVDPRASRLLVGRVEPARAVPRYGLTLLQALGKGAKADRVVRDATALGVRRLVFVDTERSVVRLDGRADRRRDRWRAVAVQAARQSGRGDLPIIEGPTGLTAACHEQRSAPVLKLLLEPSAVEPLVAVLADVDGVGDSGRDGGVVLLVGPEGGWAPDEIDAAVGAGFRSVRLGGLVLRTETAAVAALGAVVARFDALDEVDAGERATHTAATDS